MEDPLFICEIAQTLVSKTEQDLQRAPPKEKHVAVISKVGRMLEVSRRIFTGMNTYSQ